MSPIQVAEVSKIFWLKEIFAVSNSGAGGIVENIYSEGNIAINVTQILFLAGEANCAANLIPFGMLSIYFQATLFPQNNANLFHSSVLKDKSKI